MPLDKALVMLCVLTTSNAKTTGPQCYHALLPILKTAIIDHVPRNSTQVEKDRLSKHSQDLLKVQTAWKCAQTLGGMPCARFVIRFSNENMISRNTWMQFTTNWDRSNVRGVRMPSHIKARFQNMSAQCTTASGRMCVSTVIKGSRKKGTWTSISKDRSFVKRKRVPAKSGKLEENLRGDNSESS